jgi:trehalose utilization protein
MGRSEKEIVWNLMPSHPIAAGIPDHFPLECEERYAEPFYIPQPGALVFGSWFDFRSGACFIRGAGKVFYFQPGHEECPSYHNPIVQRIISNAVYRAAPSNFGYHIPNGCPQVITNPVDEFNT